VRGQLLEVLAVVEQQLLVVLVLLEPLVLPLV
jgi:hypothetical protein